MLTEIDKDFYCSAGLFDIHPMSVNFPECVTSRHGYGGICDTCSCKHRKFPTPEQFKEKYGKEWAGAVYTICNHDCPIGEKRNCIFKNWSDEHPINPPTSCDSYLVKVCACTPFGKPPADWRPE